MFHFNYYAPTQVVFGKDTEEKTGELVKAQNCKKVLIHYGSGSVKRTGLLDRVKQALEKENLAYTELGGVVPNPRLSLVKEGDIVNIGLHFFHKDVRPYAASCNEV